MSHNPNTVKSQHEITNEGGRKSEVLLSTIEELEKTKKQLDIAVKCLKQYAEIKDILMVSKDGTCQITLRDCEGYHLARETLKEIEALNEIHKQE